MRRRWIVAALVLIALGLAGLLMLRSRLMRNPGAMKTGRAGPARGRFVAGQSFRSPPPALTAGATISGRVVDGAGAAIAGALVCAAGHSDELSTAEMNEPFCAPTRPDGGYELARLFPARYSLSASATGFIPGRFREDKVEVITIAAGEARGGVDLVLRRGGVEVRGRVKDLGGGTVARAMVAVGAAQFGASGAGAITRADENGEWRAWVAPGRVNAAAHAPGYSSGNKEGMAPGSFIEVMLTPESVLSGRVVEVGSGRPVAGALVTAAGQEEWSEWSEGASALTGEDGRFRVDRLAPGRYKPTAQTRGGYGRAAESVLLGLAARSAEVLIELHPAASVSGRVVIAESGAPCARGAVILSETLTDRHKNVATNADGTVQFPALLSGRYSVRVWCEDHRGEDQYAPVVVAGAPISGLTWKVHRGLHIAGMVVDANGAPVEGVMVRSEREGGDPRGQDTGGWGQTKRDGTFRLEALLPGTYALSLMSAKEATPKEPTKMAVERDVDGVRLVLERGGAVDGVVADEDGAGVPNVQITAGGDSWSWMADRTLSRDDGTFHLAGLRPGDYRITATREGWTELRAPGSSDDDVQGTRTQVTAGGTARVKLTIERQAGRIRGQVLQGGKPVTDAYVDAERESESAAASAGDAGRSLRWSWDRQPVLTDTDGRFTLTKLAPGRYTVRAFRKGGGEATAEHVAVGSSVALVIKPTGLIEGVVTGTAPEEIRIALSDVKAGFDRSETFWRTGGKFVMRDLPAGDFRLTASAREGTAEAKVALAEGDERRGLRLTIQPRASVRGRVVEFGAGKPIAAMSVSVSPVGQWMFRSGDEEDGRKHITDGDGRFEVASAPAGRVAIMVMPRSWDNSPWGWCYVRASIKAGEVNELPPIRCPHRRVPARDRGGDLGFALKSEEPTPDDKPIAFVVAVVRADGPAAKSGLKVGDTITSVDGTDVSGENDYLYWTIGQVPPGTAVTFGLSRGTTVNIVAGKPL
jgi:protocatechuate 3,4-dioxygenase beta subunit